MVRVSSLAKLRPWSELTAQNGDGGGSCVGDKGAGRGRGPQKSSRNFVSESGRFRVQISL